MTTCTDSECKYCHECLARYLRFKINVGHIRDIVCPVCKMPDIDADEEAATNYFNYLDVVVSFSASETHASVSEQVLDQWRQHTLACCYPPYQGSVSCGSLALLKLLFLDLTKLGI